MMKKYERVIKPEHSILQSVRWQGQGDRPVPRFPGSISPSKLLPTPQTCPPLADSLQFSNAADKSEIIAMVGFQASLAFLFPHSFHLPFSP
jgi:hypothetical protein